VDANVPFPSKLVMNNPWVLWLNNNFPMAFHHLPSAPPSETEKKINKALKNITKT